jgi:hypothetical protein
MVERPHSSTIVQFRLMRAEQFARQWRANARRLASLAGNPKTPPLVRTDALHEARIAAGIVARRAGELAELSRQRGYRAWQADPQVGPLLVEIESVSNQVRHAVEALGGR